MYFILRLSLICLFVNTGLFCRNFILDKIADDLNKPVFLTYSNQIDSTLFIADQNGLIHKIIHGNLSDVPLLDITDRVHNPIMPSDERGLLGLAFHPKLGSTYFYVNYIDKEGNTIVSQFEFDSISLIAKQDSEIELLRFKQPYQNHNGGHLLFGPDNKLYIAVGDGGYAGDPHNHGQNIKTFFGSILRIEIDKDEGYRIPKDNPFYEVEDSRSEIWCYGLRNPWRFSFDRKNGDLYIGDVGQGNWEEINYLPFKEAFGKNFGWNKMEGNHIYIDEEFSNTKPMINPIFEYPNNANYMKTLIGWSQNSAKGCSVTGGYVYRGKLLKELEGQYIFGDFCTGKVWSFAVSLNKAENYIEWGFSNLDEDIYISSFAEDSSGELYVLNHAGSIYKIINIE